MTYHPRTCKRIVNGRVNGLLEEIERNGEEENFLNLVYLDLSLVQHLVAV